MGIEIVTSLVVLAIVLLFAGLLFWSMVNSRKQREARALVAQTMGLTPFAPDDSLLAHISALSQTKGNTPRHSLHNVLPCRLSDGELFLFDLVDRDIEGDSSHLTRRIYRARKIYRLFQG